MAMKFAVAPFILNFLSLTQLVSGLRFGLMVFSRMTQLIQLFGY